MAGDQLVQARDVLAAVRQLRRQGRRRTMQQLEAIEPDLVEHILEELSRLHQRLLASGLTLQQTRRLYRQSETLVLVSLLALRAATLRLWHQELSSPRLAPLDPDPDTGPPDPHAHLDDGSDQDPDPDGP